MTKFLSGVECFAKDPTTMGCLNSANLTNDDTGLKKKTDQQIKDAFSKGLDPDAPTPGSEYLFAQMPYYQFANLSDVDANAIVAYLRTVPPVVHASENGAPFDKQPTAAQWTPVVPASLPAPVNAAPADAASAANGKYLATLACSTCHTANTSASSPLQLDASKGFQGGKELTTSVMVNNVPTSKKIQSANLTPEAVYARARQYPCMVIRLKFKICRAGIARPGRSRARSAPPALQSFRLRKLLSRNSASRSSSHRCRRNRASPGHLGPELARSSHDQLSRALGQTPFDGGELFRGGLVGPAAPWGTRGKLGR